MKQRPHILVVDDDPSVTASLALLFKQNQYETTTAADPERAIDAVSGESFDLVIQDMNFSRETTGEEGLALLEELRAIDSGLPVILITAWGSISLAVEGMKRGASDFVTKPWTNDQMLSVVKTTLQLAESRSEPTESEIRRDELDQKFDFRGIVGEDSKLTRILDLIGRVAPTDASVLITGESGTGKESIAEAIHRNSRRTPRPFVKVNLGGISSTLFESEMFGHVRGAFTDARDNRKGRFEVADGGTIFLDEVGEIDPSSQVKLLRVLQDRTYEVLGSSRTKSVDVRIISATNRDLNEMVASGSFREDLLYRLNLITIHLPPLRERKGDVGSLSEHFLESCSKAYGREAMTLTGDAVRWLEVQSWPGNIRQLRQVIERAVLIREGEEISARDLEAVTEIDRRSTGASELPEAGSMTLDEMERAMIEKCLSHYDGNVTRVAEALGLSRASLYRRFDKYGLDPSGT